MAVATTGFFDGVHLGHRLVIRTLVRTSRSRGVPARVFTFWPHPRTVLQKEARDFRLLTSMAEKEELLRGLGVDEITVVPFTKELSRMDTASYLTMLRDGYGVKTVLLGYDNRMGCDSPSTDQIARIAERLGIETLRTPPLSEGADAISSTRIRTALSVGDIPAAKAMLGYNYKLEGVVVGGRRMGRKLGFPTANMLLRDPLKLVPSNGVYLVEVSLPQGSFHGMCNIGTRPTVDGVSGSRSIETNIFDFDEDIYGVEVGVSFLRRIRSEKRFDSLGELSRQLGYDREVCKSLLESLS